MNSTNIKVISEEIQRLKDQVHAIDVEVPDPSDATDGQILSVDDGKYVISDPELPARTAASTGDVLGLVGEAKTPGWVTSYNLNYSETEVATGQKWIDGKDVYAITIEYTMTSDLLQVIGATVYDKVISASGFIMHASGQSLKRLIICGDIFLSNDSFCRFGMNSDGNFVLQQKGFDSEVVYINLLYTKPTPEPETASTKKKTTKKGE